MSSKQQLERDCFRRFSRRLSVEVSSLCLLPSRSRFRGFEKLELTLFSICLLYRPRSTPPSKTELQQGWSRCLSSRSRRGESSPSSPLTSPHFRPFREHELTCPSRLRFYRLVAFCSLKNQLVPFFPERGAFGRGELDASLLPLVLQRLKELELTLFLFTPLQQFSFLHLVQQEPPTRRFSLSLDNLSSVEVSSPLPPSFPLLCLVSFETTS